jgi:hypothetical protein
MKMRAFVTPADLCIVLEKYPAGVLHAQCQSGWSGRGASAIRSNAAKVRAYVTAAPYAAGALG